MSGCPTITLTGVTPRVWDCLTGEVRRLGVPFPTESSGSAGAQGVRAEYRWNETDGTLEITFTEFPAWIDCASVEQRLRQAARACGGG